jgi:hypothetical protein
MELYPLHIYGYNSLNQAASLRVSSPRNEQSLYRCASGLIFRKTWINHLHCRIGIEGGTFRFLYTGKSSGLQNDPDWGASRHVDEHASLHRFLRESARAFSVASSATSTFSDCVQAFLAHPKVTRMGVLSAIRQFRTGTANSVRIAGHSPNYEGGVRWAIHQFPLKQSIGCCIRG